MLPLSVPDCTTRLHLERAVSKPVKIPLTLKWSLTLSHVAVARGNNPDNLWAVSSCRRYQRSTSQKTREDLNIYQPNFFRLLCVSFRLRRRRRRRRLLLRSLLSPICALVKLRFIEILLHLEAGSMSLLDGRSSIGFQNPGNEQPASTRMRHRIYGIHLLLTSTHLRTASLFVVERAPPNDPSL